MQSHSASKAAGAQTDAAYAAIDEQRAAREEMRKLLQPYVAAGGPALQAQMNLLGLGPGGSQQAAIDDIANTDLFRSLSQQGEDAILQNASATGGLRGGNTEVALAQFRPQLLNQLIEQQYQRLMGITTLGQNSAAGVGTAGMNSANNISQLLGDVGAAQAGKSLAQGQAWGGALGNLAGTAGFIGARQGWF
jgi:hypothetical protein